jgi:hypothetical protein
MNKERVHIATTLFGLLLALVLICANVVTPQNTAVAKEKSKSKTEQKTADKQFVFVSAPTITPPSSAVIECCLFAHCIFEIDQEQQFQDESSSVTFIQPQKLFQTLFRVIISPNAP